ncbi:MAG: SDR family oxidoreductase [Leptolyngbyaceae cyanobacterium HOT.MB2.61]|jgi:NAD(P)-dependent dehydrogenase (short-subunit alcohol dehydrogenase family)|nr:SDR family oxidoreductase [Leptolyngbyaceae cyanobacterium HOT.MB2.61]
MWSWLLASDFYSGQQVDNFHRTKYLRLSNKVALITGTGSEIGRESALLFARESSQVAVCDLNETAGYETVTMITAEGGEATLMGAATSQVAYTASKGGVLSFTREISVEFARQNIRVNALCPGPVETLLLAELMSDPARRQRRLVHIPSGRVAQAKEIAQGLFSWRVTSPRLSMVLLS